MKLRTSRRFDAAKPLTLALLAVLTFCGSSQAQPDGMTKPIKPPARPIDFGKGRIEAPIKELLKSGGTAPIGRRPDMSKMAIELPIKTMLGPEAFATPLKMPPPPVMRTASHTVSQDEKTKPGLVAWRKDMEDAKAQSAKSGKPILVFHMMGSLDDRFC